MWSITPSTLMVVSGVLRHNPRGIVAPLQRLAAFYPGVATPGAIVSETLIGIAFKLVGGYVLFHRVLGMSGLTLALAIFLFAESVLEFTLSIQLRLRRGSGWLFVDGVIT